MRFLLFLSLLISFACYASDDYCGKLQKIFFPGPDDVNGNQQFEAILLKFSKPILVRYSLLDGGYKYLPLNQIQLTPLNRIRYFYDMANNRKNICVFGDTMEVHTAHHYGPAILVVNSSSNAKRNTKLQKQL